MTTATRSWLRRGAMALTTAGLATGCATTRPPKPEQGAITLAREDRVHNGVRELLARSGTADAEATSAGEVLARVLTAKARGAAKVPERAECYAAGCWLEVRFDGGPKEIDQAALALNRDVGEDHEGPYAQLGGPKGRTALLRKDDGTVIEAWFVFVRSRAVSVATQQKQQIKLAAPMQAKPAAARMEVK